MRLLIVMAASLMLVHDLYSQQDSCRYSVSGKVISLEHKDALCFTEVMIKETGAGISADLDGVYTINGLCPGEYTIVCRHLGYKTIEKQVSIRNKHVHLSFFMESSVTHLEEAEVEAHVDRKMEVLSFTTLNEHDLDRSKGLNLGEMLKKVPGVTALNTGNSISKPMIHGLTGKRVLIMNNGVRLEGQQWGSEHGPEIDPFIAKRITVIKGAGGVRYGSDAIGGVILVDPPPLTAPVGIRGEVNMVGQLNGYSGTVSGMLEGCFQKTSPLTWRVQGTYKRGGDLRSPRYYLSNTGVEEFNFSAGLGYIKAKYGFEVYYSIFNTNIAILDASHIGNVTDLEYAIAQDKPTVIRPFSYQINNPKQYIRHQMIKGNGYVRTGKNGKLEFTIAYQDNNRNEYDKHKPYTSNDSLQALNKPALQFILQTINADIGWNHSIGRKVKGIVGASGLYQTNRWFGLYLIPSFRNATAGMYWIERYQVSEKAELEAGVRFDYNFLQVYKYVNNVLTVPVYNFYNVSANAGGVFHLHNYVHLRVNYGTTWRPPNVSELYSDGVHHGAATFEIGDPGLKPERAHNFNLTFNLNTPRIRAEVTAFYYYMQDFIYLQPVQPPTLTIRGAFPTFRYQQSDVDMKGFDADISVNLTKRLELEYKMSMLWAWNYSTNDWLVLMPPNQYSGALTYHFKDGKQLSGTYVSVNALYMDKQWRAPAGQDYLPPPAAYFLLGAEAGTSIRIGSQQLDISIAVTNMLDTPYRNYLNRFRYYADEMGRNVILRLKWPFQFYFKNKKSDL